MENITFIVPIHKFDNEVETYLEKCIKSIKGNRNTKKSTIIFVGPTIVINKATVICESLGCKNNIVLIDNNDDTDFNTQVNKAVMQCKTPYFSVIEFDDEYYPYWIDEVVKYFGTEYSASIYIPLTELVKGDGKLVTYANEIALSHSFANEQGLIDIDCLETYMDFNVTGSVIKTEDFISYGGLKPSLKIASLYEFLLRMCKNNCTVRVIPKVGYKHTIGRENSCTEIYNRTLSKEEIQWLIKTAKQEYFFKEDRNKTFENDK